MVVLLMTVLNNNGKGVSVAGSRPSCKVSCDTVCGKAEMLVLGGDTVDNKSTGELLEKTGRDAEESFSAARSTSSAFAAARLAIESELETGLDRTSSVLCAVRGDNTLRDVSSTLAARRSNLPEDIRASSGEIGSTDVDQWGSLVGIFVSVESIAVSGFVALPAPDRTVTFKI